MKLKNILISTIAVSTLATTAVPFIQANQIVSAKTTTKTKKHKNTGTYGSSYNKAYTNKKVESILYKDVVSYVNGKRKSNGRPKWKKSTALTKLAKFRAQYQNYIGNNTAVNKDGQGTSPIKGAVADASSLGIVTDTDKANNDIVEAPITYQFTANQPFHINDINNIFNTFKGNLSNVGAVTGDNNAKDGKKYFGIGFRITDQNKVIMSIIVASNKY